MLIAIDAVVIGSGRRKTTKQNVTNLAKSISLIGLQTPISVLPADKDGKYPLVAGRNRLEACGKLGHTEIEAKVIKDKVAAELWEIAENLHRAELTAMQRSMGVGRWIKLTAKQIAKDKLRQVDAVSVGGRGKESGVRAAARELGISEPTARRSVKIATELKPAAQREAERLGLDDNQRALERAAGVPGAKEQIRSLHRTVAEQQQRKETKARIAENLAGSGRPKTAQEAFDEWYWSLEIDMRMEVSIWLLGLDTEAYVEELKQADELLRGDRRALN